MDPIAEQLIARLRRDPGDSAAYEELKALYSRAGDYASLANLVEGWASNNTGEWAKASAAYTEAGDAVLRGTRDRVRAKALYRQALQLNVLHPDAGARLIALLEEAGEHAELADFLEAYAHALEQAHAPSAGIAAIYRQLETLYAHALGQPDLAQAHGERAAHFEQSLSEGHGPGSLDEARALADSYEQQALSELDPERKVAFLSQLAELRANQLDELEGAIAALRQALSVIPGDLAVMHQLASCLLARAGAGEPEAARTDQRRAAELFYQIAQGVEEREALPYLESALSAMPDHDGALALLERLAPLHDRTDVLPGYWVSFVAAAGEGPEADQRRLMLAQAYLDTGQLDDAIFCLKPAAEHGSGRAHELLQQAYARKASGEASVAAASAPEEPPPDQSRIPTHRPPARPEDDERERNAQRIAELRKLVQEALSTRRHDEAAAHCVAILELDPSDPEAFNVLESHYRKRRDYSALRDLLLRSTRMPGLAVDARKMRLREVATLSETKLRDAEGATSAWRGVATLDPADREASNSLKRLLKKAQQWDELASVLEREALATTALEEKAALIREIALLHRDKRKDPQETAEALRQLYALKPDAAVRDELCALLLELEHWPEAASLLHERVAAAKDEIDKVKLSAQLASVLHERLADYDGAYEVCEGILKLKTNDKACFDRMERIDQDAGNYARLLTTLERRALLATKAERPALFTRMGVIAEEQLHDIDKAADYFGDALDLAPDRAETLTRLVDMFERAARYEQLVDLLRERTLIEKEAKNRAPFYLRMARTLAQHLNDDAGAAEAYRKLLDLEENEEALRFLRGAALGGDDPGELADVLRRLCVLVQDPIELRDFLFDLAVVQHERLGRAEEAAAALRRILEQLDPKFEPAIELLTAVSEALSDQKLLALALECRLALSTKRDERVAIAKRLADLYERELKQAGRAIAALQAWGRDERQNPEPQRRLRTLLERGSDWPALLATLDALREWEADFEARDEATISAARVAFERLGDAQGAWKRLLPLVEEHNDEAERALREVARKAGLFRDLAALHVRLAQQTDDPAQQAAQWGRAADVFEQELDDPSQAFEASLRRLATDLANRELLAQVDRLAKKLQAWKRLAQVYDRLLKQAEEDGEKVALLRRHAELLVDDQPDEALDRVVRACALAPGDEGLLARAEALAERTHRSEELLVVYDRRRSRSDDDYDKLRLLLRAARLCDGALRDRERANQYLKHALAVAGASPALGLEVEAVARELDAARPELGSDAARRELVRAHREVAERVETPAATRLILRAAELLASELEDERGAFDMLRQGLALLPTSDETYAALFACAQKQGRLDSLDAHLARLVDEAIEPNTAVALLRRRGALLEGPLDRFQDAAAVYTKLLQLRADDEDAAERLRKSLRRSGRHQDLLLALNKQLQRTRDRAGRLALLKQVATTWEQDLKNRWEALDAWRAVQREAPDDTEAVAAVSRLERGRASATSLTPSDQPAPKAAERPEIRATPAPAEPAPLPPAVQAEPAAETRAQTEVASDAPAASPPPAAGPPPKAAKARKAGGNGRRARRAADAREATKAAAPSDAPEPAKPETPSDAPEAAKAETPSDAPEAARAETPSDAPEPSAAHESSAEPAAAMASPEPTPAPVAAAAAPAPPPKEPPADDGADLGALEASMRGTRGRVEELDVLGASDEVEVEVEPPREAARRSSAPPPPPAAGVMPRFRPAPPAPSSGPPRRSAPPPPPPPAISRRSVPPPLPKLGSQPARPAAPPPRAPSAPPPLPGARASSQPPPLPSQRKHQN